VLGLFVGGEVLACLVRAAVFQIRGVRAGWYVNPSRPSYDDRNVVQQADPRELSDGVLVF